MGLGQTENGGYKLDVDLYVEISGLPEDQAMKLVETAHAVCPYCNATRGNIDVRLHAKAV